MRYKDIEWKLYKNVLIPETAQHNVTSLNDKEKKELHSLSGAKLIRWISEWDSNFKSEYWYIIRDSYNGMSDYSSNTRNQIRKGLKNCDVKRISNSFFLDNCYDVYKKAFSRYANISSVPTEAEFKKIYLKIINKSEFWGVFEKDTNIVIAFAENQIRDNSCIYGSMKFDPDYLKKYPSYALIHTMDEYYLDELKCKYVSDGPRSILHDTNIQEMLQKKFNYRKAYCNLCLSYSVGLKVVVFLLFPFKSIIKRIPGNVFKKISALLIMESFTRKIK